MKVTIIIPYRGNRGYLAEAVASCEHQEGMQLGEDYEIIVQHGNCTVGENINAALEKAQGKYIKLCADDDMLAPGCLRTLYTFAEAGSYDFVCADAYNFEGDRNVIAKICSEIPGHVYELACGNTIHGGTILYRRGAMGRFDSDLWTGEEYELTLRMADAGAKFGKIDEVVFWYRVHPGQKSNTNSDGDRAVKRFQFIRDTIMHPFMNNVKRIVR